MEDAEVRERVARVEALLERVADDPAAVEALQAVVDLYGEALRRLLGGADPVHDELLSHLLLIHDLHPVPVEERVARALARVGGELVAVADGVARIKVGGGCGASSAEDAVRLAAPELERVEVVAESKLLKIGSLR